MLHEAPRATMAMGIHVARRVAHSPVSVSQEVASPLVISAGAAAIGLTEVFTS